MSTANSIDLIQKEQARIVKRMDVIENELETLSSRNGDLERQKLTLLRDFDRATA